MQGILHNDDIKLCQSVFDEVREKLQAFGKPFDPDYYATIVMQFYRRGYRSRESLLQLAIRAPMKMRR